MITLEAAAEIERLRAALRPFADALKGNWAMQPGSMKIIAGPWASDLRLELTLAHFRNASYALEDAAPSTPEKERVMVEWTVTYNNDTGPNDEGYFEWWDISDGNVTFRANDQHSAQWLCDQLNLQTNEAAAPSAPSDGEAATAALAEYEAHGGVTLDELKEEIARAALEGRT